MTIALVVLVGVVVWCAWEVRQLRREMRAERSVALIPPAAKRVPKARLGQ
jgi:hypothetical protein